MVWFIASTFADWAGFNSKAQYPAGCIAYSGTTSLALLPMLSRWNPLRLTPINSSAKARRWQARGKKSLTSRALTRVALLIQLAFLLLLVLHPWSEGESRGKLRIDFLDVGQGDAALVTFPDNTTLLVDGGGRPGPFQRERTVDDKGDVDEMFARETQGIGETVVSEYLWWRGLDRVDYLLATHADSDHIDGLNDVARNFQVRAVLLARTPPSDREYAKLLTR